MAGIVLIFAFTFGGIVWLARDVDRGVSNRSAAQSIAFQAARAGAQQASVGDLRNGTSMAIDPVAARAAASRTATALFESYGVDGSVTSIGVEPDAVSVSLTIVDGQVTVTGSATVRAERTP